MKVLLCHTEPDPDIRTYQRKGCRGRVEVHTDEEGGTGLYAIIGDYAEQPILTAEGLVSFEEPDLMPAYMARLVKQAFRDLARREAPHA